MKNKLFPLLLAVTMVMSVLTYAQTDDDQIQHAKNAITVTGSCDDALRYLDKVSTEGKMTENYFLYMAKANDCKQNNEQAIYYYKKYLEFQPANDSVKLRVAQLSDQKVQTARVANEERVAKESYQTAAHSKKRKKHNNIDDYFMLVGVSYDLGLGGNNAPFKNGLSLNYSANYPIIHNHVTLGYTINSCFLFSPNVNWFSNVFQIPASDVSGVGLGLSEYLMFNPMAVLINKHKLSLTAGPEIGIGYIYTPEPSQSFGGAASFNDGDDFTLGYGLRSNLLLGDDLGFYIEYATYPVKSVSLDYAGTTQSFPVSHNMLRLGISFRIQAWGWWW